MSSLFLFNQFSNSVILEYFVTTFILKDETLHFRADVVRLDVTPPPVGSGLVSAVRSDVQAAARAAVPGLP